MKSVGKLLWMLMIASIFIITSCGDDEPELDATTQNLIGVWETEDEVQLSIGVTGLTPEELIEFEEAINFYVSFFAQGFFGTVEFKSDKTYTSTFGDDTQTGTWEVTNEEKTLVMTETGDTEASELDIISISPSVLVIGFEETESTDINSDGTDDEFSFEVEMTLNKVN